MYNVRIAQASDHIGSYNLEGDPNKPLSTSRKAPQKK